MSWQCHGEDCDRQIGFVRYFMGSALCLECEVVLLKMRIEELRVKIRIRDHRRAR